ncbi:10 kDa chaperonin [Alphaproteobacteria bacterium]|nr:10 kDa chaperonin [Alphaproteobacteria bacterium]
MLKDEAPLRDLVIVKLDKLEDKTKGGIIIPGKQDSHLQELATIVAIGSLAWKRRGDFGELLAEDWAPRVGDRVRLAKWAGLDQEAPEGDNYRLINAIDVQTIVERAKEND